MLPIEWCLLALVALDALCMAILGWCYLERPVRWSDLVRDHVLPAVVFHYWIVFMVATVVVGALVFVYQV